MIVPWQREFFRHRHPERTLRSSQYALTASGGVLGWQEEFVYFLHYLNLFPVATLAGDVEMSRDGARRVIATRGDTLVMERFWTIRYGDVMKTYLYLPHARAKGRTNNLTMILANSWAWIATLVLLYVAFWHAGHPFLGALLVVLLGSNPFQVSEVFARDNVFGWVILAGVLMLALHLTLLQDRRPSTAALVLVPVLAGLVLGTLRHIRSEPVLVGVSCVLAYATARGLRPRTRALLVAVFAGAFLGTSAAWSAYFEAKFREARAVVTAAGGHPYDGPRHAHHFVWHALFCGLGDFDRTHGYAWNDVAGIDYALPIMKARGFVAEGYPAVEKQPFDALTLGVYWDRARKYARTPFEVPEYTAVIREKVLHDVTHEPLWYLSILARRVWRLLTDTTPPAFVRGDGTGWRLPRSAAWGFLPFAVAAVLGRARSVFLLKVLVFTLPLAGTALLVYSGGGTAYYAIAHLVAFALVLAWVLEAVLDALAGRVVVGVVWRDRLHVLPRDAPALSRPRAGPAAPP